ncbi:MAG: hypothetical protein RI575_16405, partial [Balneolaceae bacterium]|nr:hypothetical protein [Balneolaceae bacterium]
ETGRLNSAQQHNLPLYPRTKYVYTGQAVRRTTGRLPVTHQLNLIDTRETGRLNSAQQHNLPLYPRTKYVYTGQAVRRTYSSLS